MSQVHRIEASLSGSKGLKNAIVQDLGITSIQKVETIEVYTLDGGDLTAEELEFLGKEVFSDPITDKFAIDRPLAASFAGAIAEVGFKPGVTDAVGMTSVEAVKDAIGKNLDAAYTSRQYLFYGVDVKTAERIVKDLVANSLIERWTVADGKNYNGFSPYIPKVILKSETTVDTINLNVADAELLKISQDRLLALNLEEMRAIRDYFKAMKDDRVEESLPADPTDIELEILRNEVDPHRYVIGR